ncbi:MAG: fatty acid desaturase [Reyranella sp.]|nr:fatty acid desaturase [Reyranella sp.]
MLPLATWYQLASRIRNIAEHAVVPDNDDPLRNTRTTYAGPVVRLLLAPYWVNFYLEHHLFMFVPCWRLPAAHRALPIRRTVLVGAARRSTYETIVVMATAP